MFTVMSSAASLNGSYSGREINASASEALLAFGVCFVGADLIFAIFITILDLVSGFKPELEDYIIPIILGIFGVIFLILAWIF